MVEEDAYADALTMEEIDNAALLFQRIRRDVVGSAVAEGTAGGEGLLVTGLLSWLRQRMGNVLAEACWLGEEGLFESLRLELQYVVDETMGDGRNEGSAETRREGENPVAAAERALRCVAYGWPNIDETPVGFAAAGRFVKAHPLEFMFGDGDLHDDAVG